MDQQTVVPPVEVPEESVPPTRRNDLARASSWVGIAGIVLTLGLLAIATSTVITAATTPDFMPDDITDDPFLGTIMASLIPLAFGIGGFVVGVQGFRVVPVFGQRGVAVRGIVLGVIATLVPLGVAITMGVFESLSATCGGG